MFFADEELIRDKDNKGRGIFIDGGYAKALFKFGTSVYYLQLEYLLNIHSKVNQIFDKQIKACTPEE